MKYHKLTLLGTFLLFSIAVSAQKPTDIPKPQDNPPLDLTNPANIVIFIVLPLCAILFYFIWRSNLKKRNKK